MVAALNASPNLNPDIAGYDNLGAYGQWQDVAGYGQVLGTRTSRPDGLRIVTVLGPGKAATAGRGSATSRGAGRRITTAAGSAPNGYGWAWYPPAYVGYRPSDGRRASRRFLRIRRYGGRGDCGRLAVTASAIRTSAGARSRRMRRTIRGIRAGLGPDSAGAGRGWGARLSRRILRRQRVIVNVTNITTSTVTSATAAAAERWSAASSTERFRAIPSR